MISFSYICIVSILAFVVAIQADTQQTLKNNELSLSLSNEQVTQYQYEKTLQSAAFENNQDNSITASINTEITQKIHSSNELDLDNVDTKDLNTAFDVDVTKKLNGLDFTDSYQSSNYYEYNKQINVNQNGGIPSTATSFPGSNGSPPSAIPTSPNGNLNSVSSAGSNVNGIPSQPFIPMTYPIGIPRNINEGSPNNPQTSNPNYDSGSPKIYSNGGTPSTSTSSSDSNGSPTNTSPNSPNRDLTEKLAWDEKLLNDDGLMQFYRSYQYQSNSQNIGDQNGGFPSTATSFPGSNGSPPSAIPTSPNENLYSVSSAGSNVNGIPSQQFIPMTYPIGIPRNINGGSPNNPQTSNPNYDSGSPKIYSNGRTPSTPTSSPGSNGSPTNTSPNPPNRDLTDKLDWNAKLLNDDGLMQFYRSYQYQSNSQNIGDQNSGFPTTATSFPGSNGSPPSAISTSPNENLYSVSSAGSNVNGIPSQPFIPMTYPIGIPKNINGGSLNNPQTSNPNYDSGSPKIYLNGRTPSTPTSSPGSNGSPTNTSPNPPNRDLTDKLAWDEKLLNDDGLMQFYRSYQYQSNSQNIGDQNSGFPTTATSFPGSNGSPPSAIPTSPNENLYSVSSAGSNVNGIPSQQFIPMTYPIGIPRNINGGSPNNPQTSNPNYDSGSPKIYSNGRTPSTPTSSPGSNGSPTNTSPNPPNRDLTDKLAWDEKLLNDDGLMQFYQSYQYQSNSQNIGDQNSGFPTTATSFPGSNGSPPSAIPTSPNENLYSVSSAGSNVNGIPSQQFIPMTYPIGIPRNINGGSPNNPQTSNPNYDSGSPKIYSNGRTPSTPTSSPGSNGSPTNTSPNPPNRDLTDKLDWNAKLLNDDGLMQFYRSYQYQSNSQNIGDQNGGFPTTATSFPGSNGSPPSAIPTSPNENLYSVSSAGSNVNGIPSQPFIPMTYPIGIPRNMNGGSPNNPQTSNPNYDNGSPNIYSNGGTPSTPTSSPDSNVSPSNMNYPNGYLSDDLIGQATDSNGNMLTSNLQKAATPNQFSFYPGFPPTLLNRNFNDALSGGGVEWNPPSDMNDSPQTVDQTPTGSEYSIMDSGSYRFLKYDNRGYELQNTGAGEVSNDGQINLDDMYKSDNYNDMNKNGVIFPLLKKDGDTFFYETSSTNTAWSSDGDYDTTNDGYNGDGYFQNVAYDDGNQQEPSFDSYIPNLNGGYENIEPFRGNTFIGNVPFDKNIYPGNILYDYNKIGDIESDQTKTGIDEFSPGNNRLSQTDFYTFSNTPISPTDSYLDTDLSSNRQVYDFDTVDGDNKGSEIIDSNNIGPVDEKNVYDDQVFNEYNMQSNNVPEYNELNKLSADYATNYSSNLRTFEASSSNTGTNADIYGPDGPQILDKQSSDLKKQRSNLNNLVIDNVQLDKYLYRNTDKSNVNTLADGATEDNSNGFPTKNEDTRLRSIQNTVLNKNNALDVGQNVYDANGQVIGKIYKPSAKTNNRHKYSDSSSSSSPSDSLLSDDIHAIGDDIKRAARDAIGNVHDHIKDAYDTTKAIGKAVGNIVENAVSGAVDDVQETAKTAYQKSKDAVKDVENVVNGAVDDVQETAKTAYQKSKDAVKDVEDVVSGAVDDVQETAKTAYQGLKNNVNVIKNAVNNATDSVEKTADNL